VAILGAGLAGCGVALELAGRGEQVVLFDRRNRPMQEASRWCEGKVHLGLVYANDASFRTAQTMLDNALEFGEIIERWVDPGNPGQLVSEPFEYAVLRDSLLSPAQIEAHFKKVEDYARARMQRTGYRYIGDTGGPLFEHADVEEGGYNPDQVIARFTTAERAIDTHRLADLLADAVLAHPNIEFRPEHKVENVETWREKYRVVCRAGDHRQQLGPFNHVVNALWANRLVIDARMGHSPQRPFTNRLKLGVNIWLGERDPAGPTTTYLLGPYGDIVRFPSGRIYLSWYPAGMIAMLDSLQPIDWRERLAAVDHGRIIEESVAALQRLTPAFDPHLEDPEVRVEVEGGAIFAWGSTDIDDRCSELHERFDIGPQQLGNYVSLDTGKFSTAPRFSLDVAEWISPARKLFGTASN
jgi:2-polyprenyl-6-methoxyphenol hydroxylase-like FAD-dependent oxidoreductase